MPAGLAHSAPWQLAQAWPLVAGAVPPCPLPSPAHPPLWRCPAPAAATLRELNGSVTENLKAKTIVSWGVSAISADPDNMMVYPCAWRGSGWLFHLLRQPAAARSRRRGRQSPEPAGRPN